MLFMVVEHFRDNDMVPVYHRRLREGGRSLPEGSTMSKAGSRPTFLLLPIDALGRSETHPFEIVPVITSAEARGIVEPYLEPPPSEPAPAG
jgi:hypothetical protein